MGNYIIGNKELQKIQNEKGQVPIIYSKGDITKFWGDNFKYGSALNDDQINSVLNWLNTNGHTQDNLMNALETIYYGPYNPTINYSPTSRMNNLKSGLSRLFNTALNVVDIPRKGIASFVNKGQGAYNPAYILDVTRETPATPIMGYQYAQEHPVKSAIVDVATPFGIGAFFGKAAQISKNIFNYATRKAVPAYQKNRIIQSINQGTTPKNVGYEVVQTSTPTRTTEFTTVTTGGPKKGIVVTRTGTQGTNGPRNRPMVKNHNLNVKQVHGNGLTLPGIKISQNVTSFPLAPFRNPNLIGIPQFVPAPIVQPEIITPEQTIVEKIPVNVNDSEIINWAIKNLGLQEGDTIKMPDGRLIKYELGPVSRNAESLGRIFDFGVQKEYDKHNSDPKKQPNVPTKTKLIKGKVNKSVKVTDGKNPMYYHRDSSNYFPYIIEN